jgi:molecular chaperone GrpE (heat shock protein)
MSEQNVPAEQSDAVIPFPNNGDPLDKVGNAACTLVQQAATMAEEKAQHIMGVAHKLALQLRAAEDQLARLQAEAKHYRERADRAEKWLHRIALEIQHKFFTAPRETEASVQQPSLEHYAPKRGKALGGPLRE